MRPRILTLCLGVSVCLAGFLQWLKADDDENHGLTVKVSVQATDTSTARLHYRWRATDGVIQNLDASTTTWTLPSGPGLHFAYVLVSNGLGGYTERRLAVNTDTIGDETETESAKEPMRLIAPAAPAQQGDYYRSLVNWGSTGTGFPTPPGAVMHDINAPGAAVHLESSTGRYPASGDVFTDLQGQFIIPGVAPGDYVINCSVDGVVGCGSTATMVTDLSSGRSLATTDYISVNNFLGGDAISGTLVLGDGTPCGTNNEFFGVRVTATATLLDASIPAKVLAGPVAVNEFGDYSLPSRDHLGMQFPAAHVLLKCENAAPVIVPQPPSTIVLVAGGTDLLKTILTGVKVPVVSNMTATSHGRPLTLLTSPAALFLPPHTEFPEDRPPTPFPSSIVSRSDGYLALKGVDTRLGACQYYKAVGAVQRCDAAGNLIGAVSFDDWKRAVKIGPYATHGAHTFGASFINKVDLNLARVHQSISYGPNHTAAVVCNHLGPGISTSTDFLSPAQTEVDSVVDNEVRGKNLVACVAMDYTVSPGVNNNQPFIRFLIFGPSGQLLPSINLDERREKFVPGTCVVCHGGDHYAGKFPEDGTGFANVGGHFLPYDVGNFEFSSKPGLTKCDQEEAIFRLNQNVLNAGPTVAERELIKGWYSGSNGSTCPDAVHVLDEFFVPKSWQDAQSKNPQADIVGFYQNVNARSCRTCHVAMIEGYNFDHYTNMTSANTNRFADVGFDFGISICGGSRHFDRDHMMPNSLITFNRFWLSANPNANTTNLPNQLDLTRNFFISTNGDFGKNSDTDPAACPAPAGTTP
jgi:hypothetical protein